MLVNINNWQLIALITYNRQCRSLLRPCIYISWGRAGTFEFAVVRRLRVAANLFSPEFICFYITHNLTVLSN